MITVRNILKRTAALNGQLPIVSEANISQKRHTSSYEHYLKYGHGGRNSFNGIVTTVFGATGFLGRYVVNRLARTGTQIIIPFRGIEDDFRHLRVMGDLGQIVFVNYDLKDPESIAKSVTHSNVVVNLVGKNYPTRNFSFEDCLVTGAQSIAQVSAENNVNKLIHVSALGAKGNSPSKYMQMKARSERVVNESFPNATIIRPAPCYGHEDDYFNRYAYLRKLPLGVPLVKGGWETTRRPVFIPDVAQAIVNASIDDSSKGKTFELYGPEEYYLHDIVDFIFRSIRKPFRSIPVPEISYTIAGFLGEKSIFNPRLTRDMAIRQFLSDEISDEAYTFEDFGITPCNMNTTALTVLRRHRDYYHHDEIMDEINDVCKPSTAYR